MNKQPFTLNWFESLFTGLLRTASKYQLRFETPLMGNLPEVLHVLVNDRIVVLQIAPKALSLESRPERELVHGRGVLGPLGELISIYRKLLLKGMDGIGVFKEEYLWLAS